MALTESDIKIIIAGELKKKGFQDAEKATNSLDKKFKSLAKTVVAVFSVREVVRFGKAAVKAFEEDEVAARRFESALKGVNIGFATPEIENYLENLEKFTAITKGELRPAFQTLATTTRSVAMSQDLLNTAIDVSTGTGVNLETVVNDLSRSFLGNNASLAKYQLGLSKSELKAKSFNEIQELLNNQFSGQRAAFLDTYAGKVSLLEASYERMQTTIGSGLVDAFTLLAGDNGIEGATSAMERFGVAAADVIRGVGVSISEVQSRIPFFDSNYDVTGFGSGILQLLDILRKKGQASRPLFFPGGGIGQPGVDKRLAAIEEAAIKRQKELEILRAKQAKEQSKLNRLKQISLMLIQKEARFDLNRIQLAAALQGKLTDEERQRVEELLLIEDIKQAIAEKDVDKAEKLLDELNKVRTETEALAESLLDLEAGNPFSKWPDYFAAAKKNLQDLFDSLAKQQLLLNELTSGIAAGRAKANQSVIDAKTDRTTAYAVAAGRTREEAERATREAAEAAAQAAKALLEAQNEAERVAAQEGIRAAEAAAAAAQLLTETIAVADFATALAAESEANEFLGQSMDAAFYAGIIPNVEITVNVEGNVTTAEDLAEVITDIQYNYQRTGKGILLSSRAI
jgi:hypothetical protein